MRRSRQFTIIPRLVAEKNWARAFAGGAVGTFLATFLFAVVVLPTEAQELQLAPALIKTHQGDGMSPSAEKSTAPNAGPPAQQSAIAESTGAQSASKAAAAHPDYILTPKGVFAHKECVHAIDAGDVVDGGGNIRKKDGTVQVFPACVYPEISTGADLHGKGSGVQPPTDNGWTETAYWNAPDTVGTYQSMFHVPAAPTIFDGQLIYIFPALEGDVPGIPGSLAILQTVLQYGYNGNFGGNYWTLSPWVGGGGEYGGHYFYGIPVPVYTGDVIRNIEQFYPDDCNSNGCRWAVVGLDNFSGVSSSIYTYINVQYTAVYGLAIEVYGVDDCAEYPTTYDNAYNFYISAWGGPKWTPSWSKSINVHTCGEQVTWDSQYVNLYY